MADIRKEQERDELHRAIWAIAYPSAFHRLGNCFYSLLLADHPFMENPLQMSQPL